MCVMPERTWMQVQAESMDLERGMFGQCPGTFKQILVPDVITVGYCETCMLLWQIDAFDCGIILLKMNW